MRSLLETRPDCRDQDSPQAWTARVRRAQEGCCTQGHRSSYEMMRITISKRTRTGGGRRERPETQRPAILSQPRAHTDLLSQLLRERTVLPTRQRLSLGPRLTLGLSHRGLSPGVYTAGPSPATARSRSTACAPGKKAGIGHESHCGHQPSSPRCQACFTGQEIPGT